MKHEEESRSAISEEAVAAAATGVAASASSSVHVTSDGTTIDFLSPEFNRIDDLTDYPGNFRSFETLDNIVTADLRHQMERRQNEHAVDPCADVPLPVKKTDGVPEPADTMEEPLPLTVVSEGQTLIIDADIGRAVACGKLLSERKLTCTLLVTKGAPTGSEIPRDSRFAVHEADSASIRGAFGGFSATVSVNGEQKRLTEWLDDKAASFDLVLDLQSAPSYAGDLLPLGYYAPGADPARLREAIEELPEMRGRFIKPRYTAHLKNRCLHGRSHAHDCIHCMEVCPFGAIQSVDRNLIINPYLCQGCGACTLVCPADAIRRVHPSQDELMDRMRSRLETSAPGTDGLPTLVITDSEKVKIPNLAGRDEGRQDGRVHFEVEQIGFAGLEMLLFALAYGAGSVVVACGPQNPPAIRKALEGQMHMAGAILQGLGIAEEKIRLADGLAEIDAPGNADRATTALDVQAGHSPGAPLTLFAGHDKRSLVRLAVQHLYDCSGVREPCIPLPPGSPFGSVAVDSSLCTLCMACAVACPTGALSAGGDVPRLAFLESRCHQCRLCEVTCPEGAIHLSPRILCDPAAVETPASLREVEPFRCIECGIPFASQVMINRMREKLTGHWMYAGERQLRRLQMCRTCRTRDALSSQEMKSWIA